MDDKSCEGVLSQTRTCGLCKVTVLFLQKLRMFTTQEIAACLIIGVKNVTTNIVEAFLKRKIRNLVILSTTVSINGNYMHQIIKLLQNVNSPIRCATAELQYTRLIYKMQIYSNYIYIKQSARNN